MDDNNEEIDERFDLTNVNVSKRRELEKIGKQKESKEQFRSAQSLGLITQRFLTMRTRNEVMNLNDIANELQISKRRVYDVINVLEGLGYIEKAEKNQIKWLGDTKSDEQKELECGVEKLRQQEKLLEQMLRDCQALVGLHFEDPVTRPYNYIQKADLRRSTELHSKSIIVKSEVDTNCDFEVQVSDPETNDGRYDMIVKNSNGHKSHALLFTHEEGDDDDAGTTTTSPEDVVVVKREPLSPTHSDVDSLIHNSGGDVEHDDDDDEENDGKPEHGGDRDGDDDHRMDHSGRRREAERIYDDIKLEDIETFVLPTSSDGDVPNQRYIPETPGRGIFSPLKTLIDPTCILPTAYSDAFHITPRPMHGEERGDEPTTSIINYFSS